MTIKLAYLHSSSLLEIMVDTTCHYLYCMSRKIFQLNPDTFILKYNNKEIEDNSKLIYSILSKYDQDNFLTTEIEITVQIIKKITKKSPLPLLTSINESSKKLKRESIKEKSKKHIMMCQLCSLKHSICYCRNCDIFICFECNVRNTEHRTHDKINLEDGDSFLGSDVYREELTKQINIIDLAYQKADKWKYIDDERENNFKYLFDSLEQIKNDSKTLAMKKSMYNIDKEIIKDFIEGVNEIPRPKNEYEIEKIFNMLNLKEVEIRNFIKCLNLIIIKAKYNVILKEFFNSVQQDLDLMKKEINKKLSKCEEIKIMGIQDIKFYLEENEISKKDKKDNITKSVSLSIDKKIDSRKKKQYINLSKKSIKEIEEKISSNQNVLTEKNINRKLLPKLCDSYKFNHHKFKKFLNLVEENNINEKIIPLRENLIGNYNTKTINVEQYSCKQNKKSENKTVENDNYKSLDLSDIKKSSENDLNVVKIRLDRVNLHKSKNKNKLARLSFVPRKSLIDFNSKIENQPQENLSQCGEQLNEIKENKTPKNSEKEKFEKSNIIKDKIRSILKKDNKNDLGIGKNKTKYKLLWDDK